MSIKTIYSNVKDFHDTNFSIQTFNYKLTPIYMISIYICYQ